MSNLAAQVFTALQLSGMAAGAYIGYQRHQWVKKQTYAKVPSMQTNLKTISEEKQNLMFNIASVLSGVYIGYYMFPLTISAACIF